MSGNIWKVIPRRLKPAVKDAWHDDDGYWIMFREGWHVEYYFAERTIHEDTLDEIKGVLKFVKRDK